MKGRLIVLASVLLALSSAENIAAQSQPPVNNKESAPTAEAKTVSSAPATDLLSEGTFLLAEFAGSVNARKLKPGDRVQAHVVQDVLSHGRIVVPVESRLIGHVTEVTLRGKDQPESILGMVFDKAELRHQKELLFQAVVVALAPPAERRSRVDQPDLMIPAPMTGMPRQNNGMMENNPNRTTLANSRPPSSTGALATNAPVTVWSNPSYPGEGTTFWVKTETQPMSAGMFGVHGIKNIALSQRLGSDTPGPIIVSSTNDVKLDYGTQVILRISGAAATK
jgi:biotin carboxyl carrier protein